MKLSHLLVIVSTSSSTLIPVTIDPSGKPMIDAVLEPLTRPHVVHLGCYSVTDHTSAMDVDSFRRVSEGGQGLQIPTINNEPITVTGVIHSYSHDSSTPSTIGIGPGSNILRVGRSIDFVRQSTTGGFLRLGGTEQDFIANDCLPNSVMRMGTFMHSVTFITRRVATRMTRVSIGANNVANDFLGFMDSEGLLLTMPQSWVADIYALLPPSGEPHGHRRVFSDCAHTIQRLPTITLSFTAGGLRLFPEDYTRQTGQDDTCELLIDRIPAWSADQMVRFNPLLIPGINGRSTENEIILCDSAIEP